MKHIITVIAIIVVIAIIFGISIWFASIAHPAVGWSFGILSFAAIIFYFTTTVDS